MQNELLFAQYPLQKMLQTQQSYVIEAETKKGIIAELQHFFS
jgi:hypothetical protein